MIGICARIGSAQGPIVDLVGKRLINFSSNDYLGLANDSRLREAAVDAINKFGVGAGAVEKKLSLKATDGGSAIVPLLVGDEHAALDLSSALQAEGFFVPAIRYPTVAKGAARLRITVTAAHQGDQIRSLAEAIKRLAEPK